MKMFLTSVICYLCVFRATAERIYYRPYEYRSVPSDTASNAISLSNSNIETNARQPQIVHTTQSKPVTDAQKVHTYPKSFNEILHKMDHISKNHEKKQNSLTEDVNGRASLGFTKPSFEPWPPYREPSIFLEPVKTDKETVDKLTPKFDLLEPVTAKMSSKVSGLMELVLALAGTNSNNFLMKGFKQILIDGIIKPMMLAKGGLKVLISKLSIPVISLLLINIEVLITVWWLWEDCTEQTKSLNEPNTFNDTKFRKTT